MTRIVGTIAVFVLGGLMIATGSLSALAGGTGGQGCSAIYWQSHPSNWPAAGVTAPTETDTIKSSQTVSAMYYAAPSELVGNTLLQALRYGGGTSLLAAKRNLLRTGVAAYLNAADDRIAYPLRRTGSNGIVPQVNAALSSSDRSAILALTRRLARVNTLGCPLN